MKKLLVILLALSLIFAFAACGQTEAPVEEEPAAEEATAPLYVFGVLTRGGVDAEEFTRMTFGLDAENGVTYGDEIDPLDCGMVYYDDLQAALLALDKQDIPILILPYASAKFVAAQMPERYIAITHETIWDRAFAFAVRSEDSELLDGLNSALVELEADGTLAALEKQYLNNTEPTPVEIPAFEGAESIKVLVTGDLPPFDYVTADGKAAGYNVALTTVVAAKLGVNVELVYANTASRFLALQSGKADVVFCTSGIIYEDGQAADFSSDLPDGISCSNPYTVQVYGRLLLAEKAAE